LPERTNGAQRASLRDSRVPFATRSRSLIGAVVAAALALSLVAAPAAASNRPTARIPSQPLLQATVPRPWLSEEKFIWTLTNCTRTGGWVQSNGTCKGYGSGRYSAYVKPLKYAPGFSDTVPRPYARQLALKSICTHFYGGTPLDRMKRAGYTWIRSWGENIGCRTTTNVKAAVLGSHLFFQGEKSSNGGHWRNIKNPRFTTMGVGIWQSSNRVRLVEDFVYSP
jgi:hypothetical protein